MTSDSQLEQVLDCYLHELSEGLEPDPEEYVRRHPQLEAALRGVFRTLEFVEATGRTLNASKLSQGQRLGEFRIVREIGRGGMGVVYEAVQDSLDRRVALKVLATDALLSETAAERFKREANTAARLQHHNIVPVYAIGEEQGIRFYAMQFIDGRSLEEHLQQHRQDRRPPGRAELQRIADWGRQVADALAHAHAQGTVHRDIKPSNLLLDSHDNIWVTDFGLARAAIHPTITITGDIIGTARYMSPEQARGAGSQLDERTDIYSLGSTLYELLTLKPPFDGETRDAILLQLTNSRSTDPRDLNPAISRDLQTVIGKCLEPEPRNRYASARDLAEDLRRFVAGEPIKARRTPLLMQAGRYVSRHRPHSLVVLLLAVLAAGWFYTLFDSRRSLGEGQVQDALHALLYERRPERSAALLDQASERGIDSIESRLCRGLLPLLEGRAGEAVDLLTAAHDRAPDHLETTFALALAHTHNTDFVTARELMDRSREMEPDTALAWLLQGLLLGRVSGSTAIEALNRAIMLRPDFTLALETRGLYRGNRLLNLGDRTQLQPMLDDANTLVVLRPGHSSAFQHRARGWLSAAAFAGTRPELAAEQERWIENCRQDLARAAELESDPSPALLLLRGTYRRFTGDLETARDLFEKAAASSRDAGATPETYLVFEHALTLYSLGDTQAALNTIGPVQAALLDYYPMVLLQALLLAESHRLNLARELCRNHLESLSGNATALFLAVGGLELLCDHTLAEQAILDFERRQAAELFSEHASPEVARPPLDYLLGRIDAPDLLSKAADHPGNRCEYAFYVALRELGRGNRAAGVEALEICLTTGVYHFGEYRLAFALRERARASLSWPAWVRGDNG